MIFKKNKKKKNYKIKFSKKSIIKANELLKNKKNINIRIFIKGGGCSGFIYKFVFDKIINKNDLIFLKNNVKFVIDFISYQYLIGSKIDYKSNFKESKFIINNPNIKKTCSCGSSFSL